MPPADQDRDKMMAIFADDIIKFIFLYANCYILI